MGTCSSTTLFIQEIRKSIKKSISEIEVKVHGKELISFALSMMASLFAFFHSGRGSNWHGCGRNEKNRQYGFVVRPLVEVLPDATEFQCIFQGG
jgi:hypothetical protein